MSDKEVGTVKWFSRSKSYGFISLDSGKEVFAHFSEIKTKGYTFLRQGQTVEFTIQDDKKGAKAKNIVVINKANKQKSQGRRMGIWACVKNLLNCFLSIFKTQK